MWETKLGVQSKEWSEAGKGSRSVAERAKENIVCDGRLALPADDIFSSGARVSLSRWAADDCTLVFLSAWRPCLSAALCLAPVYNLDSSSRC